MVTLAVLVFVVLGFGRLAWRIWRDNEEMEPGGSMGDQMLGAAEEDGAVRDKRKKRRARFLG